MMLALMTLIGSTLTLPGIAGLVLGVAMAVDANVLIYERIREELRAGKTPIAAIDAGFTRAFVTIVDSQLTTLACAIIMFWLGSGPIRGFAVTLTLGILTSVFASVTVVRLLDLALAQERSASAPQDRSSGLGEALDVLMRSDSELQGHRLLPARPAAAVHALSRASALRRCRSSRCCCRWPCSSTGLNYGVDFKGGS